MFGSTYPIFGHESRTIGDIRDSELYEYLRWEYRPADRAAVILAARRRGTRTRRRGRPSDPRKLLRRLRAWVHAVRGSKEPAEETPAAEGDAA